MSSMVPGHFPRRLESDDMLGIRGNPHDVSHEVLRTSDLPRDLLGGYAPCEGDAFRSMFAHRLRQMYDSSGHRDTRPAMEAIKV